MFRRHLLLATLLTLTVPAVTWAAQAQYGGQVATQWETQGALRNAYREGYNRGARAGEIDGQRGGSLRFRDQPSYRQADFGYRSEFGSRDRYRSEFRNGFESGYRMAFAEFGRGDSGRDAWNNSPSAYGRFDPAWHYGFDDGYEAGVKDARDRNRFNPTSERRYRSANHGYERQFGPEDRYKDVYRDGFRDGYDQGYRQNDAYPRGR